MTGDRKKVLIVDDEPFVRSFIEGMLKNDYDVCTADNGQDGLHMAWRKKPDLVILDIDMPKMNGIEVCRALKNDPAYRHIPVIMLTVRSQIKQVEEGVGEGADAYIAKPFTLEHLENKIKELIRNG